MANIAKLTTSLRRAFVAAWILLGVAGALDQTIALEVLGERVDLLLPHLRYGHVMFNLNPRTVRVYEYTRNGGARRNLAELVETRSLGYQRARLALNVLIKPDYLAEVCFRAARRSGDELTFFVDEYEVDVDPRQPSRTLTLRCDGHGLAPR